MDYKNGKIYCIRNTEDDDVYVGSTCQPLSKRMAQHRMLMNSKTRENFKPYIKMREIGNTTLYIELLEQCPCENREQLRAKEGEYIRKIGSLNTRVKTSTVKEYQETYKNQKKSWKKQYREENRDILRENARDNYKNNPEKFKEDRANNKQQKYLKQTELKRRASAVWFLVKKFKKTRENKKTHFTNEKSKL